MTNGFLGNDASFMLDFVVTALVLVVPALLFSLFVVKRQNYKLHRTLQLTLGIVLLVAVSAFEVDMRMHGGWENIVNKDSNAPRLSAEELAVAGQVLTVHLVFAISTPLIWIATIILALRRFSKPPVPNAHSSMHKTMGWIAVIDLVLTSVTGLVFYYVAFIR